MRIVDSLRAHSLCSPFLLIFSIASCSLLPLLSFLYRGGRSSLSFPESQIMATVEICSYQKLPIWPTCKTYSAACLAKEQTLNLLGHVCGWSKMYFWVTLEDCPQWAPCQQAKMSPLPPDWLPTPHGQTAFPSNEEAVECFTAHQPHRQAWAVTL